MSSTTATLHRRAVPLRSIWPSIADPWVLLVQLRQVRSSPAGKARPSGLRAGENIVTIGRVADAGNDGAAFRQRRLHAELVVVAVQIVNVLRNNFSLEVLPGTAPDAVARIDGRLAVGGLRAQIGTPGLAAGTGPLRQFLAIAGQHPRYRRDRLPCRARRR